MTYLSNPAKGQARKGLMKETSLKLVTEPIVQADFSQQVKSLPTPDKGRRVMVLLNTETMGQISPRLLPSSRHRCYIFKLYLAREIQETTKTHFKTPNKG